MPVDTIPTYCTQADVARLLSPDGMIAFADHDQVGDDYDGVLDDCIQQASDEITLYLNHRYAPADLQLSRLVTRWCATIAAYFLCMRRGNPIPESIAAEFQRLLAPEGLLPAIADGKQQLPGVTLRCDMRPSWSNLKVDRRWPHSKQRVTRVNSSDAPTVLTQDTRQEVGGYDL